MDSSPIRRDSASAPTALIASRRISALAVCLRWIWRAGSVKDQSPNRVLYSGLFRIGVGIRVVVIDRASFGFGIGCGRVVLAESECLGQ